MKSVNPVKMLAAFALVLLVSSATEGWLMNKCELKAKLDGAQFQQITVMGETITVNSLITRLVCKASSLAFNTSFVKNITVYNKEMKQSQAPPQAASQVPASGGPPQAAPHRGPPQAPAGAPPKSPPSGAPPQAPPSGAPPQAAPHRGPPQVPAGAPPKSPSFGAPPSGAPSQASPSGAPLQVTPRRGPPQAPSSRLPPQGSAGAPPKPQVQDPTKGPQSSSHEMQHPEPTAAAKVVGHLYGVFQLSDRLACSSSMMPSLNICNMTCSALTDDDITDDITCLKTVMNFMKAKPKEIPADVKKNVEMLVKECQVSPDYFADCV